MTRSLLLLTPAFVTLLALVPGAVAEAAAPVTPAGVTARRLEDIHIEGEIPVPQVLFVTGRDQRRFLDFQHRHYVKASLEAARGTAEPAWIRVVDTTKPQGGNR